jgi:hypothetical protein
VPSCFGLSVSGDAMYLAGSVVSLRIWLVETHFLMSFVIEVGSLIADGSTSQRMNCGRPV